MSTDIAVRSLSGAQKAALVLMNMSTERAAAVLKNFDEAEALAITTEIARMRNADGRDAEAALEEFRARAAEPVAASAAERSGKAVATQLIQATFEPERAEEILEQLETPMGSASFAFFDGTAPKEIVRLLRHESPETAAFVLVQLAPDLAAKVLMLHETERRLDIAQCVATMGTPVPEAAGLVADVLRGHWRAAAGLPGAAIALDEGDEEASGQPHQVQYLVDIMNHAAPEDEGEILGGLRDRDSGLAEQVRAKMLAFEDVPKLQDRDLQQLLRGLDVSILALALKGADPEVGAAMKANMSERNRTALEEEAAELGRVAKSRVEEARNQVVRALRAMAATVDLELKAAAPEPGADPAGAAGAAGAAETAEPEEEEYVD